MDLMNASHTSATTKQALQLMRENPENLPAFLASLSNGIRARVKDELLDLIPADSPTVQRLSEQFRRERQEGTSPDFLRAD